ncbi:GTP 3',8-cyclase MoaA [Corynebacterium minutissimum]|uniref:GTP 3',8-cyclase n=1 Tax=Corynebacterium minutissimum TaxID=38301 RepID=A0A2X4RDS9_9CORY|nr:GTP 3',8-cyclase MoaA [Corynebacterium minutissimum]KHO29586.1 molybdenum cofactor biosynthesis protein MoeA [Corynebacterium minutissimum]QPS58716.1 GTP 3',8-cyclase MoaA [Corynebacterium minutissimum]QQA80494.1 GTP 3',8-cyclase MoaA [Corynebacterium minutissimum]SQI00171.1 molybdenum cofactor biosynthesis protein A [Corynebacterium minutissimum]VEG05762.1 molybdenum cofactor biosynthesis protein A [Corynebacterium minutissimum]
MSDTTPLPLPRIPGAASLPADVPGPSPDGHRALLDRYGRQARDLRVSLTDRCNLRCTYCMPAEGFEWMPTEQTLSDDETIRLIRLAVEKLGIRQVRFTGGEPLLRNSLEDIIAATTALRTDEGIAPSTALTTNGLGLDKRLEGLQRAGLDRVNISLDTLDRELYARLTRRDRLPDVLASIDAALAADMAPVKINAVIMPGINESAIVSLARFSLERGAELRFIEQMPLGPREEWERSRMVTAEEILARLREEFELTPAEEPRGSAPAALWEATARDGSTPPGRIGVIASVTRPFCGNCDRTRLTTDGAVRNCLFGNSETSLRDLMRAGASDDELAAAWAGEMWRKLPGHGVNDEGFLQPDRPMSAIGG